MSPVNNYNTFHLIEDTLPLIQYIQAIPISKPRAIHTTHPKLVEILKDKAIVNRLSSYLGTNIALWRAEVLVRQPNSIHRWHADVEALRWPTMNIWIGLSNVGSLSSLSYIPLSETWPSPQKLAKKYNVDLTNWNQVLTVAKKYNPKAEIIDLPAQDGDCFIFNARMWHGVWNRTNKPRMVLAAQYCPSNIDIQKPISFDYPTVWSSETQEKVII